MSFGRFFSISHRTKENCAWFINNIAKEKAKFAQLVGANTVLWAGTGFFLGYEISKYITCKGEDSFILDHGADFNCKPSGDYCHTRRHRDPFQAGCSSPSDESALIAAAKAANPFSWTGAMVGALVGGVLGVASGVGIMVCHWSRRERNGERQGLIASEADVSAIASGQTGSPVYRSTTRSDDDVELSNTSVTIRPESWAAR